MSAVPYQPDRSAKHVDRSLRRSLAALDEAHKCAVLWFGEVMKRHLYREFGCSSIYQYATERLGFSRSRTRDFVLLARKLEDLPKVKRAIEDDKLGYTKARELMKVVTPETQETWLEAAKRPRRELVREVKRAKQAARVNPAQGELVPAPAPVAKEVPVRFSVEFTPEQEARRAALLERLHKLGGAPTDRAELLLEALAALVDSRASKGPRGPSASVQIHVHDHGDRMTVVTNRGERELGPTDAGRLKCDAVICKHGERAKATIPPRIRREVLARDGNRCQVPGCGRIHFLEIHHMTPRTRGGTNDPANLITLCAACHRLHHRRKGAGLVRESAPTYRTRTPGGLRIGAGRGRGGLSLSRSAQPRCHSENHQPEGGRGYRHLVPHKPISLPEMPAGRRCLIWTSCLTDSRRWPR